MHFMRRDGATAEVLGIPVAAAVVHAVPCSLLSFVRRMFFGEEVKGLANAHVLTINLPV